MSKLVEIIEDKQVIIDKSDLDFIYNQIEEKAYESYIYKKALKLACFDIYNLSRWENSQEEVIEDSIKFYKNKAKEIIEANNQLKIIEKEQLKDE